MLAANLLFQRRNLQTQTKVSEEIIKRMPKKLKKTYGSQTP